MDVLVAYGTVEGHSRTIAERVAKTVRDVGHVSVLVETARPVKPIAESVGAAILVAPVHVGRYPEGFEAAVRDWADRLATMPSAFVSVSLAVIDEDAGGREATERYEARLADKSGWRPAHIHHAAGALMFSEYDFFRRWVMRAIARRHGHKGAEDHVFTDWPALERFVREFLAGI